jgi:hypothetical protein
MVKRRRVAGRGAAEFERYRAFGSIDLLAEGGR